MLESATQPGHFSEPANQAQNEQPLCWRSCLAWGLGVLFYFYEFMLQTSMSSIGEELMLHFDITGNQLGMLSGVYLGTYALMQLPVGLLMDRFGPRRLLTIASLLCASGSILFVSAHTLLFGCIGRGMMGIGAAFAVVGCLKLASLWFPIRKFAFLAGLMVAVGMLGAASGQTPVAYLVNYFGWISVLKAQAVAGVFLALIIWQMLKPPTKRLFEESHLEGDIALSFSTTLKMVFMSKQTWIAALFAGLMFVPTIVFGNLWGVPFIKQAYGISATKSANIITAIYFGWVVGGPLFGWFSDYIAKRRLPMVIATIGSLLTLTAIWQVPETLFMMGVAMFLLGVFSSGFVLAFSVVREVNSEHVTATAMGFINTLNSLSGFIALPIWGRILDGYDLKAGTVMPGSTYSLPAFQYSVLLMIGCIFIALCLLPFIRETNCKTVD